jgi:hypothetical protein
MSVVERLASRSARRRVKTQLAAQMPTDIATIVAEESLAALGIEDPDKYIILSSDQSAHKWIEQAHERVIVVVSQSPTYRGVSVSTGSPNESYSMRSSDLMVTVLHHHVGASPIDHYTEADLDREEVIHTWSEVYNGAVIQTMRDHVQCDGASILKVELVSESTGLSASLLKHGVVGVAETAWTITQNTLVSHGA